MTIELIPDTETVQTPEGSERKVLFFKGDNDVILDGRFTTDDLIFIMQRMEKYRDTESVITFKPSRRKKIVNKLAQFSGMLIVLIVGGLLGSYPMTGTLLLVSAVLFACASALILW